MKLFDVTLTIHNNLPVWPGDESVMLERTSKIEKGDIANISSINMSVHTGTHVDAPFHFFEKGYTIDQLSLDVLVGKVQVIEISNDCKLIDKSVIDTLTFEPGIQRVLFKTSNSQFWNLEQTTFITEFVGISEDASIELIERGIQLVGIDYLSIAPFDNTVPTHLCLLKSKVVIIEGLDLRQVTSGIYTLYCLPLKFKAADGAPARVILVQEPTGNS